MFGWAICDLGGSEKKSEQVDQERIRGIFRMIFLLEYVII